MSESCTLAGGGIRLRAWRGNSAFSIKQVKAGSKEVKEGKQEEPT